ncbi:MAG TPA: hypothetical protein VH301_16110 [Usitatibacter sp.]|jgi:hypothetical protein|nr:hypothetical protein [Usitatibacter sp.]
MATPERNDTQRDLEQRALRNVRGLVDKMDDIEALDKRTQRRYLATLIGGTLAAFIVLVVALWFIGHRTGGEGALVGGPPAAAAPAKKP